jgi:DNA polymerase I-like protein with 3'-5' exonuclease and polymerase domains
MGRSEGGGRFYPDFLLHTQASGRWSTNNPPLAQLPEDLRDIIGPDPDTTWLGWDWQQIEPRILEALVRDDEALARWDEDRYLRFTSIFFPGATPAHPMWDHYRKFTKRKILKLHYGGRPDSFTPGANKLGLDKRLETQASLRYLASRPKLVEWQQRTAKEALRTRESRTFLGRLRRLLGDSQTIIGQAYDHPMQGGVSDIFNLTHVQILDELPWLWWVYGAHDNQWWGCPNERVEETWPMLKAIVEQPWDVHGVVVRFPASYKERVA